MVEGRMHAAAMAALRQVQGAGCRVQGSECRVQGAGCRVQGAGCRVHGCRVHAAAIAALRQIQLIFFCITREPRVESYHSL